MIFLQFLNTHILVLILLVQVHGMCISRIDNCRKNINQLRSVISNRNECSQVVVAGSGSANFRICESGVGSQ